MKYFIPFCISILVLIFSGISLQSCAKDNLEDLTDIACDTTGMTYETVRFIFEKNCYECHNQHYNNGSVKTDTYYDLTVAIKSGKLWNAINHNDGYTPMPYQRSKIPACDIAKIKNWINNDMPLY